MRTTALSLVRRASAVLAVSAIGLAGFHAVAMPGQARSPERPDRSTASAGDPTAGDDADPVVGPASASEVTTALAPPQDPDALECSDGFVATALAGCLRDRGDGLSEVELPDGDVITVETPHAHGGGELEPAGHDGHAPEHGTDDEQGTDGDEPEQYTAGTRSWTLGDVGRRPVACAPRGTPRTVAVYAHQPGRSRFGAAVRDRIQDVVERSNELVAGSARDSGGPVADLRFACRSGGALRVLRVAADGPGFTEVRQAVVDGGHASPKEKYLVFVDMDSPHGGVAGMAQRYADDRRSLDNRNNGGVPMYGVVWERNWDDLTPLHELTHMMGGVQSSAPGSDGRGHCSDSFDVMCSTHDDRACPSYRYDCGHDTYFTTAAARGSYLANHWNIGWEGNRFVAVKGRPTPNTGPTAAIEVSCGTWDCAFDASGSSDVDGRITRVRWDFGDGAAGRGWTASHTYRADGRRTVRVTVTDDRGATATTTTVVQVANEAPEAAVEAACGEGRRCSFDGAGSTDEDGTVASWTWDVDGHRMSGRRVAHRFDEDGTYRVTLVVTDDVGRRSEPEVVHVTACGDVTLVGQVECRVGSVGELPDAPTAPTLPDAPALPELPGVPGTDALPDAEVNLRVRVADEEVDVGLSTP